MVLSFAPTKRVPLHCQDITQWRQSGRDLNSSLSALSGLSGVVYQVSRQGTCRGERCSAGGIKASHFHRMGLSVIATMFMLIVTCNAIAKGITDVMLAVCEMCSTSMLLSLYVPLL